MNILKIKNRKEVLSWCLYDFANQPFTTIIVTFLYGAFFVDTIAENNKIGTTLWTFAISSTAIIVSLLSPILGAIADNGGYRKYFLIFFTYSAVFFTLLLYLPQEGDVLLALLFFIIANISFELGTVFCNSYLPDISDNISIGTISGFSWGLGFFGGLLAFLTAFFLFPDLDVNSHSVRKINLFVGVWFLIFSIPTFLFLKDKKRIKFNYLLFRDSITSIRSTFRDISNYKTIFNFLLARIFYNDALVTIFALGGIYAVGTLEFSLLEVMQLGIVLNLSAAIGSWIFGVVEDKIGVKKVINLTLIVLIISTLLAIIAPETNFPKQLFWIAGILIGFMVGPNQSSSRSLMSRLTPKEKVNEFFGFYAFAGKATSFLGPFLFGLITSLFNQQIALWVVVLLFLIGLILFQRIKFDFK